MSKCCCGGIGCVDCFITDADSPCCRLHPDDILMFRIQRPSWSNVVTSLFGGDDCPCTSAAGVPAGSGTFVPMRSNIAYAAAHDILAMYSKFTPTTAEGDRSGFWFVDNGTFGNRGGTDDCARWRLWPELCPQPIQDSGELGPITGPRCCDGNCSCSSAGGSGGGIRKYIGPAPQHVAPNCTPADFVCSEINDGTNPANNVNLTNFQKAACDGTQANRSLSPYDQCITNDASTSVNATCVCPYDQFYWLKGIYDDYTDGESNAVAKYRHWEYQLDPSSGTCTGAGAGLVETSATGTYKRLAETIIGVFHKEKWFQKIDHYDGGTEDCDTVSSWACQVPGYWVFACAGIPVFSWEVGLMQEAGKITSSDMERFFKSICLGEPAGKTAEGRRVLEALESKHWLHADSVGLSILQLKDFAGTTLPTESSAVANTERRLIRKDLAQYTYSSGSHQQTVVRNKFYHARPGGWTHVCSNPPPGGGVNCGTVLSEADILANCPQVPRTVGCKATTGNCGFNVTQGQEDDQGHAGDDSGLRDIIGGCLNAWPFPQCASCSELDTCSVFGIGPCQGFGDRCLPSELSVCGDSFWPLCQQTTFRSECDSIRFDWSFYIDNQKAKDYGGQNQNSTDTTGDGVPDPVSPPFIGRFQNHAWLFILNQSCDSTDSSVPKTCAEYACPPGPDQQTPVGPLHFVPPRITKDILCNRYSVVSASIEEGARGSLTDSLTEPSWYCQATQVLTQVDIDDRDPGLGVKQPTTVGGCGRYLGAETGVRLGACCITTGGTTTCVDAVTQAQCVKCNNQAGVTAVYKGDNTCCGDSPC